MSWRDNNSLVSTVPYEANEALKLTILAIVIIVFTNILLRFCLCSISIVFTIPAFIKGIVALRKIVKSKGLETGAWRAISAIIISGFLILYSTFELWLLYELQKMWR